MLIGLVSDTHNDQQHIKVAVARLRGLGVTKVLHAGDVTTGRSLRLFKYFDVWIAQGNMDRDPALRAAARELFGPNRLSASHTLDLDGTTIALIHNGQSTAALDLIRSGDCRYVIHGHSHRTRDSRVGDTRVINPGALGNTRWQRPTLAALDLTTSDLTWIEL